MRLGFSQPRDKIPVTLQGQGIPTLLSIDKTLIDFKSVRAGGVKRTELFTLRNLSSDNVQVVPEVFNTTGAPFKLDPQEWGNVTLEPDVPLPVTVEYQPMEATTSRTTLAFGTKSPQKLRVVSIDLKGEATLRILDVDEPALDWKVVDANGVAQAKTVTVLNSSTQSQRISVAMKNTADSPFSANVNGAASVDIPGQGSIQLTVSFRPDKAGDVTDEVQIMLQDNPTTPEVTVAVKGSGRLLTAHGGGCSATSTGLGSAGLLAMLTLLGLHSRRRRRE
jgi:MYXO-CTERM domain-containing protein